MYSLCLFSLYLSLALSLSLTHTHTLFQEEKFAGNLWPTFASAARSVGVKDVLRSFVDSRGEWDRSFFYTNFEVSSTALWRSPQYRAIFQALDYSGGFYLCRWGDGPIHLLAVMLLLEDQQVLKFARVPYWHQTFVVF